MTVQVRRMGPWIGAEITGVDLRALDEATFAQVYRAWLDHAVIVVRDQQITPAQYLDYCERFGKVVPHPSKNTRHPEVPQITLLGANKRRADGSINMAIYARGEGYHTDGSYEKVPYKATQLYSVAIPSRGGDTLFASTYAAWDALPEALKARLQGLQGAYIYGGRTADGIERIEQQDRVTEPVLHPLARVHPETGRTALYFDPNKLLYIKGLPAAESDALIEELRGYMIQPDAVYRHQWRRGDAVIWDNRCTYHKAAADYPPEEERIHWRVSIQEWEAA